MSVDFGRRPTAIALALQQLSSHPEVNQEHTTAFKPNNQILAASIESSDPLSLQLGGHSGGVIGPREARVEYLHTLEAAADQLGLEPCPDGLDLGKLRHRRQRSAVALALGLDSGDDVDHDIALGRRLVGDHVRGFQLACRPRGGLVRPRVNPPARRPPAPPPPPPARRPAGRRAPPPAGAAPPPPSPPPPPRGGGPGGKRRRDRP